MRILVTGASGFVGSRLIEQFLASSTEVVAAVRAPANFPCRSISIGSIDDHTVWERALIDVDTVVHLAGRVHIMADSASDPLAEFRHVNVEGTLNLARQAVAAGLKRFVFISSIKVNGESTRLNQPFTADDKPFPIDPYGISKYEAEEGLRRLAVETGLEVVIIRSPLVYGPGVKANFLSMMRWLKRGIPLPFGAISNKRSLIFLDNLVDIIITCTKHPAAANQIFLVSDGNDYSTTELLRCMGQYLGRSPILLPVPSKILQWLLTMLGKKEIVSRILGSLQVDNSKTFALLGWKPVITTDKALELTAKAYLAEN